MAVSSAQEATSSVEQPRSKQRRAPALQARVTEGQWRPALRQRSGRHRDCRPFGCRSQSPLEEFSVGSAHLDAVDAVEQKGVLDRLVHQVSRGRRARRIVDRHDGPAPRKHRQSDTGLVSRLIGPRSPQASEGTSGDKGENGRQNSERNDHVHVDLLLMAGGELPPSVRLRRL
jgi:hypothetical protein